MSKWNHRVIALEDVYVNKAGEIDICISFGIHEVMYDDNGAPDRFTMDCATVISDNIEGLQWQLDQMMKATTKPILWGGDKFPQEYKEEKK